MLKVFLLFACFTKITESFQTSSRFKRQTQNHCFLPDHPANGEIKILGQEEKPYLPNNDVIANTIIDLSCTNGTVTETGGLSRAICYQGKWKPSISEMGGCVPAHLFTKSKDVLNTGSFIVAAGKHYKDFGDRSDLNAQSSRIKHLYIPNNYGGISQNYTGDLAIVKLEDPFTFTEYVQPVCIDWTNQHEFSALKEDNKGVFAGWGLTKQGGKVSYSLLIVDVPYKSNRTCSIPSKLKNFYTYDKFCAGYSDNQTSVCIGDEGGGLFFRHFDNKFYIRGILSVVPEKSDGCDPNAPALYTKVSTYLQEIETITKLND